MTPSHVTARPDVIARRWWLVGRPPASQFRRGLDFLEQARPPPTRITSPPFSCNSTINHPPSRPSLSLLLSHPIRRPLHCPERRFPAISTSFVNCTGFPTPRDKALQLPRAIPQTTQRNACSLFTSTSRDNHPPSPSTHPARRVAFVARCRPPRRLRLGLSRPASYSYRAAIDLHALLSLRPSPPCSGPGHC